MNNNYPFSLITKGDCLELMKTIPDKSIAKKRLTYNEAQSVEAWNRRSDNG